TSPAARRCSRSKRRSSTRSNARDSAHRPTTAARRPGPDPGGNRGGMRRRNRSARCSRLSKSKMAGTPVTNACVPHHVSTCEYQTRSIPPEAQRCARCSPSCVQSGASTRRGMSPRTHRGPHSRMPGTPPTGNARASTPSIGGSSGAAVPGRCSASTSTSPALASPATRWCSRWRYPSRAGHGYCSATTSVLTARHRNRGAGGTVPLVHLELTDRVAVVTLDDPARRNSLSVELGAALAAVMEQCEADDRCGAVVVTGAPPALCAGADLSQLGDSRREGLMRIYDGFLHVARSPLPTVAAVNGPAVGAGMNLALACDLRLAGTSARFDTRFLDLGIHPGGGHTWMFRH